MFAATRKIAAARLRVSAALLLALALGGCATAPTAPEPPAPEAQAPAIPPPPSATIEGAELPGPLPAPEQLPSATAPPDSPAPDTPAALPPTSAADVSANAAVVGLLQIARANVEAGRYPGAVASIERALRIEPKNARLWHELARLRYEQGDYTLAENLAARSNSWAGADNALRRDNWLLIAETRARRGDDTGAETARERARQFAN